MRGTRQAGPTRAAALAASAPRPGRAGARVAVALALPAVLAACGPMTPERAAEVCEARAQAAQGPTGTVTLGANSSSGTFLSGSIGISADALRGRDPLEVYQDCVFRNTGAAPIRPAALRPGTYR